ncbi:hypothetical protein RhiirC2_731351, partial [Rhizophagus irregularis]
MTHIITKVMGEKIDNFFCDIFHNSRNHNTIQDHRHYDKPTSLLISSNSTDLGQSMPIVDALYNEDKFQVEDKLSRQVKLPCQNASRLDQQNHYDGNQQDEPHINSEFDDFSRRRKIVQIMFRTSVRSGICMKITEFDNWKI